MTPSELLKLKARIQKAEEAQQRRENMHKVLMALQGSTACQQHEVVAARLTESTAYADVIAVSFYTQSKEYCVRTGHTLNAEQVQLLCALMRSLACEIEAEYDAS